MQLMATGLTKWWSKDTVAVVTGANKGIGFGIVKGLTENGVTTVLTARDPGRGQKVVDSLKAQGLDSIVFHPLEVTSAESADNLANWLKNEFGGVNILVNNAAIYAPEVTYATVKQTMDTNFYGVKTVTSKLLSFLRPGARIVNVSSDLGQLRCLGSASLAKKLSDVEHLSEEMVDSYARKYLEDVKAGCWKEEEWCTEYLGYSDSKVLLNAYTRVFAKRLSGRPDKGKIYVNVVNPGWIATDMSNHTGQSVEEGADTPVWLALLPEEKYPNGEFFSARRPLAF